MVMEFLKTSERQGKSVSGDFRKQLETSAQGEVTLNGKNENSYDQGVDNLFLSQCFACNRVAVWIYNRLVHPISADTAPEPNSDLPGDVRQEYDEAAKIVRISPRGAAALLRLALQRFMPHLGQTGANLNSDIAALVKSGLDERIQKSLDIVRVIGNHSVHPGQIDLRDDVQTATTLFKLVNLIADSMITRPKEIAQAYDALPEKERNAIEKRDKKS